MDRRDSYLSNLPKVDENSEIQENSLNALTNLLPTNQFCLRDERIRDYGVDASLEILENGNATNFRTQIQLKGTRSLKPNKDGSYSLQVDTHNLNYLLNASISIYILYIEPKKEFRFVWASTEFQRLAEVNPTWIEQGDITLRFTEILDLAKLDEIKEKIISRGVFGRNLNETLLMSESSNVVLEINSETFEITDKDEILNLINIQGINLVNEGFSEEILERINLLDSDDREKSFVKTVRAYAEYYLGHYRTAKEIISLLKISGQEIAQSNQQIIDWLDVSCDYRLGNIDSEQHIEKLKKIAEIDDIEKFSSNRFDYLHRLLLNEKKLIKRKELLKQLKEEVQKVSPDELLDENILQFKYSVLEAELGTIILEFSKYMSNVSMRKRLNFYKSINELAEDVANLIVAHKERVFQWEKELNEIFAITKNQRLKADVLVERVLLVISSFSIIQVQSKLNESPFEEIEDNVFEECKKLLEVAIEVYSTLNLYERKLRAESYLADLMSLKGNSQESEILRSNVFDNSDRLSYAQVKANLEIPLPEIYDRVMDATNSIKVAEKWGNNTDKEIEEFAQGLLENLELPKDRFQNVVKDCLATRDIAREKLNWCEEIELHQDLTHTKSKETYYATDVERFGYCSKHNHTSMFGHSNYEAVILAFKKTYCENCPDRKQNKDR